MASHKAHYTSKQKAANKILSQTSWDDENFRQSYLLSQPFSVITRARKFLPIHFCRNFHLEEVETLQLLDNCLSQAKELENKLAEEKKCCMRNLQSMLSLFNKSKEQ